MAADGGAAGSRCRHRLARARLRAKQIFHAPRREDRLLTLCEGQGAPSSIGRNSRELVPQNSHAPERLGFLGEAEAGASSDLAAVLELLNTASRAVAERLEPADDSHSDFGFAALEMRHLTDTIEHTLQHGFEGEKPAESGSVAARQPPHVRRRLLELLHFELLRQWRSHTERPDLACLVLLLSAIDDLRRRDATQDPMAAEDVFEVALGVEVLAEMAHDLRSPLTSILTLADALRRGQSGPVTELQRRQLGLIYSAALGLSTTASDMTELVHSGDLGEERGPLSVRGILESVEHIVLPMAEEKGVEIEVKSSGMDRRLGYGLALGRVLLNLTTNSLKFTERGWVKIQAQQKRDPARVQFSVEDTGPGMDAQALAELFKPVRRRARGRGFCFSGTGLGLTICRRLVRGMGSELEIETEVGQGTRYYFDVELPLLRSEG